MGVFIVSEAYENGDAVELTVPNGHTWKVMAIGEASAFPDSRVRITYTDTGAQHALYSRSFVVAENPGAAQRTLGLAIGAPFDTTPGIGGEGDTSGTINEPLPDVKLPSGSRISVEIDDPAEGNVFFLIED